MKQKQTTIFSLMKKPNDQNEISEMAQSEQTEGTADRLETGTMLAESTICGGKQKNS